MATKRGVFSVIATLHFVVASVVVFLFVPIKAAAPLVPVFLLPVFALYPY